MKTHYLLLLLIGAHAPFIEDAPAQTAPQPAAPAATPTPPPAAPPQRSAADLEKLVAPIALYPDPLLATILPASVYPLEIVQAARFVANTNNLAKLDEQPWDDNVKAVARIPQVIKLMNDDLPWTMELGEAFLAQDKAVMDAIQAMRAKAQSFGTLKTSPQQVVIVTNVIIEKTVEQRVVVVTNTIVQIQPANPQVIYVPTYTPAVVYAPPPPSYPGLTFAAGVAVGAIIANNCDWHHGGCYHGDVNVNRNVNVNTTYNQNNNFNQNNNVNRSGNANNARSPSVNPTGGSGGQQKRQPDQSRLSESGTPSTTAASKQARGYGSGSARPSTQPTTANRAAPSGGSAGARPSTGSSSASRPSPSPSASSSQAKSKPPASRSSSSGGAFSGAKSGSSARSDSSRGSSSRSSGRSGGGSSGGGRAAGVGDELWSRTAGQLFF